MFRRTLGAVMPALLIVLVAVAPSAAASGPPDIHYDTSPVSLAGSGYNPGDETTCHSVGPCTSTHDFDSFHNDHGDVVTVWAVNGASGDVDYWQCIDAGMYSGMPGSGPGQGSVDGGWPSEGHSTYLGDFAWFTNSYHYEWYEGCWRPCTFPFVLECILLTSFKEDHPQREPPGET